MAYDRGYRDAIVTNLALAATLETRSHAQYDLLNEIVPILWRFDDNVIPESADSLIEKLRTPIAEWLPESLQMGFAGTLSCDSGPGPLAGEIFAEFTWNPIFERNEHINVILDSEQTPNLEARSFRHLVKLKQLASTADGSILHPNIMNRFYSSILQNSPNDVFVCPACGHRPHFDGDSFVCRSITCMPIPYDSTPPHRASAWRTHRKALSSLNYTHPVELTPSSRLAISLPLLLEQQILQKIKLLRPIGLGFAIELAEHEPGFYITNKKIRIYVAPVCVKKHSSILEYAKSISGNSDVCIVTPSYHGHIYRPIVRLLPTQCTLSTISSFSHRLRQLLKN